MGFFCVFLFLVFLWVFVMLVFLGGFFVVVVVFFWGGGVWGVWRAGGVLFNFNCFVVAVVSTFIQVVPGLPGVMRVASFQN